MSAVGESTPPRTGSDPKLRRTLTVFAVLGVAVATTSSAALTFCSRRTKSKT